MGRYVDLNKVTVWRCPRNIAQMREWVFSLPVEDVKPITHAHWIKRSNPNYSPFDGSVEYDKICSNCGCYNECFDNYCPDCGAQMDEEV